MVSTAKRQKENLPRIIKVSGPKSQSIHALHQDRCNRAMSRIAGQGCTVLWCQNFLSLHSCERKKSICSSHAVQKTDSGEECRQFQGSSLQTILEVVRHSIVASIPACHAGDRGSIPRRGEFCFLIRIFQLLPKDIFLQDSGNSRITIKSFLIILSNPR